MMWGPLHRSIAELLQMGSGGWGFREGAVSLLPTS